MGQQAPGPTGTHDRENRVEDRPQAMPTGTAAGYRRWEQGLNQLPLGIGQVREVATGRESFHAPQPIQDGRMPDFSDGLSLTYPASSRYPELGTRPDAARAVGCVDRGPLLVQ